MLPTLTRRLTPEDVPGILARSGELTGWIVTQSNCSRRPRTKIYADSVAANSLCSVLG
jgi:hypothetical protein